MALSCKTPALRSWSSSCFTRNQYQRKCSHTFILRHLKPTETAMRAVSFEKEKQGITDVYYQQMVIENPRNPLFASNYARFLIEVRGDYTTAEKCCERAILYNSNDGSLLSLYASMVWENHRDASLAEHYHNRAVMASPDDCGVLASYAHFLWVVDDREVGIE